MASSASKTVGPSAAVALATGPTIALVHNLGPYVVFLGGTDVSTGNGYKMIAGEKSEPIRLASLETLRAISEDDDSDVRVLTTSLV